jgi:CHASE3 domain sensor protein
MAIKWSVGSKIGSGFALALLVLITIGITAYRNTDDMIETAQWRSHTYQVLANLEKLQATVRSAESDQRGYLITGDQRYLEPYNEATRAVSSVFGELRQLTTDNAQQQRRLDIVQSQLAIRLDELQSIIDLRRSSGFAEASARVLTGRGVESAGIIQKNIADMRADEEDLLAQRNVRSRSIRRAP